MPKLNDYSNDYAQQILMYILVHKLTSMSWPSYVIHVYIVICMMLDDTLIVHIYKKNTLLINRALLIYPMDRKASFE